MSVLVVLLILKDIRRRIRSEITLPTMQVSRSKSSAIAPLDALLIAIFLNLKRMCADSRAGECDVEATTIQQEFL